MQHLSNVDGKILQQFETGVLSLDGGAGKLADVVAGSVGTIQTKGSLSLAVNSLHGLGALIAPQDLSVTTYTPDADTFFQAGRDAFIIILGNIRVVTPSKPNHVVFDHRQGGERYGTIDVPKGLLDEHGEQGKGYLEFWASHKGQKANRGSYQVQMTESYIEIDGSDKSDVPPLISDGHDILLSSEGNIINKAGHVAAGNNLTLQGASIDNYGYNITKQYSIYYWDRRGARVSSANSTVPIKSYLNGDETITWGNIIIIPGPYSGSIKDGNNINGDIKGDIKTLSIMVGQEVRVYWTLVVPFPLACLEGLPRM